MSNGYPHAKRSFGNKRRTRAETGAALTSLLIMRAKPYSERDIEGIATSHGTTVDKVKAELRERGKGALIQADAWRRG